MLRLAALIHIHKKTIAARVLRVGGAFGLIAGCILLGGSLKTMLADVAPQFATLISFCISWAGIFIVMLRTVQVRHRERPPP